MRTKIAFSLTPIAIVLLAGASPRLPAPSSSGTAVLSELNECIQRRFLNTGVFGINRILPLHGIRQFRPENARERAALENLDQKGYEVALFLAGRQILNSPENKFLDPRSGVQGPAYITRLTHTDDLLKPGALLADARAALASFDSGDGYELQKDGWTVMMRPLRATSETCVQCHTRGAGGANANLKVGDALGVVLYVYHPS